MMPSRSILLALLLLPSCAGRLERQYAWNGTAQRIPGRIQCEYFDRGGEGMAYHASDPENRGSGMLNPADGTLLNEFRMKEGVDISYTKSGGIDDSPFSLEDVKMDQLYVDWTEPGEWINYRVQVERAGLYAVGLMYTPSGNGGISLILDGRAITPELPIPSTRPEEESLEWRQWHHWNREDSLAAVYLPRGMHVLTLRTLTHGIMNYDYLEFNTIN